jgi:hypothetical protein
MNSQNQYNSKSQPLSPPVSGPTDKSTFTASNWKAIGRNTLTGTCDIETRSGFVFRSVMLHERDSKRWVQIPSKEYRKDDGTRGFVPVVEFANQEKWRQFNSAALARHRSAFGRPRR